MRRESLSVRQHYIWWNVLLFYCSP